MRSAAVGAARDGAHVREEEKDEVQAVVAALSTDASASLDIRGKKIHVSKCFESGGVRKGNSVCVCIWEDCGAKVKNELKRLRLHASTHGSEWLSQFDSNVGEKPGVALNSHGFKPKSHEEIDVSEGSEHFQGHGDTEEKKPASAQTGLPLKAIPVDELHEEAAEDERNAVVAGKRRAASSSDEPAARKARLITEADAQFAELEALVKAGDEQREQVIKKSRDIQKAAKHAIFALQRNDLDRADTLLDQCEVIAGKDLLPMITTSPELRWGSFTNAMEVS